MPHKCPIAQKVWRNSYMKRRRAKIGDHLRSQERARSAAVQQFIRSHKLKFGCSDCGYSAHHAAEKQKEAVAKLEAGQRLTDAERNIIFALPFSERSLISMRSTTRQQEAARLI